MSINNNLKVYNDSLIALQAILNKGKLPEPEHLARFRENTYEFFNSCKVTPDNFHGMQEICDALKNIIAKTKKIETLIQSSTVKTLRSITDPFRAGKDEQGLEAFKTSLSSEMKKGEIYERLWEVREKPTYDYNFGKLSFHNEKYSSSPLQKAFAFDLQMLDIVCKALQEENIDIANVEFNALPQRLKEEIFEKLSSPDVENSAKVQYLIEYRKSLLEKYQKTTESDLIRILQQNLQAAQQQQDLGTQSLLNDDTQFIEFTSTVSQLFEDKQKELQGYINSCREKDTKFLNLSVLVHNTQALNETLYTKDIEAQRSLTEKDMRISHLEEQLRKTHVENEALKTELANKKIEIIKKLTEEQLFAKFVAENGPLYTAEQIQNYIDQGKKLVEQIKNGEAQLISTHRRKEQIVPLMWYMLYFAVCKNQGFRQGTIVFRDPGHAIVKFFLECGSPAVYARPSTHFSNRLLPSIHDSVEKKTTYGIDINGLPGNMGTVNFAPIESPDDMDWSFFKPENFGLGDWYQFAGHSMDYIFSRAAHVRGTANGPNDRKEHIPYDIQKQFIEIYNEASLGYAMPENVAKFGIAGMTCVFESMMDDPAIDQNTKDKMKKFIDDLGSKYDYPHVRNGHEAILGNSFIQGASPDLLLDAQMHVKYATTSKELTDAIATLKGLTPPLTVAKEQIMDELVGNLREQYGDTNSPLNSNEIFAKLNETFSTVKITVDDIEYKEEASTLFQFLKKKEPFASKQIKDQENFVLLFMAMALSNPTLVIDQQIWQWFDQGNRKEPIFWLKSSSRSVHLKTGPSPKAEITREYALAGITGKFGAIEGKMSIDINSQTAQISATL